MASWCLPRKFVSQFLNKIKDGTFDYDKLKGMSSEDRRKVFKEAFGEEHSRELNLSFEKKLVLKDQKNAYTSWIRQNIKDPKARENAIDKVQKLEGILQPANKKAFLADLAEQKLGVAVTDDEAREILDLSKKASDARTVMETEGWTPENGRAYGRALLGMIDKVNSLKPGGMTTEQMIIQTLNLSKTALTGVFHFSAPIVQNWGMMTTKQWWEALPKMLTYFADEENYKNLMADIVGHPLYAQAKKDGLGLTDIGDVLREEDMQSSLLDRGNQMLKEKTGIPNLFRASSRGFTGFNNYVRFNRYVDLVNNAKLLGEDVSEGSKLSQDLADVVNNFSGRATITLGGKRVPENVQAGINAVFFAPKKLAATVQMFNPAKYYTMSPFARKAAIRQLLGSIAATAAVIELARVGGYDVNLDPTSQDFLLVNIQGQKFDMTGGNAIYARLMARLITNKMVTGKGEEIDLGEGFGKPTRTDLVAQFLRGKLSPVAGALVDAGYGKDPANRPFSLEQEVKDKFTPIVFGQFIDFMANNPEATAAYLPSLLTLGGVTMRSPFPAPLSMYDTFHGVSMWGEPSSPLRIPGVSPGPAPRNAIDREAERLGLGLGLPLDRINGVKLTAEQYKEYIVKSGQYTMNILKPMMDSPQWGAMPDGYKKQFIKDQIQAGRKFAATDLQAQDYKNPQGLYQQSQIKKTQDFQKLYGFSQGQQ